MDLLNQALNCGIMPLELVYKPVHSFSKQESEKIFGYRSVLRINSPDLGVLLPKHYSVVANRDSRCVKLAKYALPKVFGDIKSLAITNNLPQFLSVNIPNKLLFSSTFYKTMVEIIESLNFTLLENVLLEIDSSVLFEDMQKLKYIFESLKKLGFKIALFSFGGEFCPTLRIMDLPIDYVILDESVSMQVANYNTIILQNILNLTKHLNIKVIIPKLLGIETKKICNKLEVDFYQDTLPPINIQTMFEDKEGI